MSNEKKNGRAADNAPEVSIEQRLADAADIIAKANATAKVKRNEQEKKLKNAEIENKKRLEEEEKKKAADEASAKKLAEKKMAVLEYTEEYRRKLKERERAVKKPSQPTKKQLASEKERLEREREAQEALRREEEEAARRNAEIDELLRKTEARRAQSERPTEEPQPAPAPTPAPTPTPAPAPMPAPIPEPVEEPERIVFNIGDKETDASDGDDNVLRIDGQHIGGEGDERRDELLRYMSLIRAERRRIRAAMMNEELAYRRELTALEAKYRAASYAAMERARFERLDYGMLLANEEARYRNELNMLAKRHAHLAGSYMNRRRMLESSEMRFSMENPDFGTQLERERFAYNRELDALIARRNAMAASYAQKRLDMSAQRSFAAEDNALLAREEARYKQEIDDLIARREALARQYEERKRAIEAQTVSFAQSGTDFEGLLAEEERLYNARLEEFRRRHDEMEKRYTERVNAIANAEVASAEPAAPLSDESPLMKDDRRRMKDEEALYEYEKYNEGRNVYTEFDAIALRDPAAGASSDGDYQTIDMRSGGDTDPFAGFDEQEKTRRVIDDDDAVYEYEKHQSAAAEAKEKNSKKSKLSYEESMPVVTESFVRVAEGDSIFSGTVITKGKLPEYLYKIKRADKAFAKEIKKLSARKAGISTPDLAVNLLDIIAIRRKALVMHIECLQTVVSIDKKKNQRKYAHQLSLAITDYNAAVNDYMQCGNTRLSTVSVNLPSEIMHATVSPTVPCVTYTFPAPVLTEDAPSKGELKAQRKEEKRLDKMVAEDLKRLHSLVDKATDKRLTATSPKFEPVKLFTQAEEQMRNDLRALTYRFDYLEMSYTSELALGHYRHALNGKTAKREIKEIKKNLKYVKKMRKKAIKLERLDNIRYYTVLCTSPEACRAKKRADRDAILAMHTKISDMLNKRDEANLELISLYSAGRGRSNKKFNRRLEEVALGAAAKCFKKTKSAVKKIRKSKTYDPQIAIDVVNKRIALAAELAKEEHRQKKLKIKSISFRNKLKTVREEIKKLDASIRDYVKKAKGSSKLKKWIIALIIIAAVIGAAIAVYIFRSEIKAMIPTEIKETVKGWFSVFKS